VKLVPISGEDGSLTCSWAWGSSCRRCFTEDCVPGVAVLGASLLLIQNVGTAVLDVVFCCLGLVCLEASLLVQLLQIFLLPKQNDPVLLSDGSCLELAPAAATQKWMDVSYLVEEALSLCLL